MWMGKRDRNWLCTCDGGRKQWNGRLVVIDVCRHMLCDLCLACYTVRGRVPRYRVRGTTSVRLSVSSRWSLTHM